MCLDRTHQQIVIDVVKQTLDVKLQKPVVPPAPAAGYGHRIDC